MALSIKLTSNKYRDGVFYFVLNDHCANNTLCVQYQVEYKIQFDGGNLWYTELD